MQHSKLIVPSLLVLVAAVISFNGVQNAEAVSETVINRAIQMNRVRVNFNDVNASANVRDPGDVCNSLAKRVVIETVPAGGQISTIVTKARTTFVQREADQLGIIAVRAEQGGVQLSNGDIAVPLSDITDTSYIENRLPNNGEIAFYDEDASWDVVAYFCGRDEASMPIDINGLTRGSVDFYITETRN